MTNRERAFVILGYPANQSVARMVAGDFPKLGALVSALDEAEERGYEMGLANHGKPCAVVWRAGQEEMRERAAKIVDGCGCSDKGCNNAWGRKAESIRALPVEE